MDCGTGKGTTSSFSMWMVRERRPANAPCQRQRIGPRHSGACAPCVPPTTPGANGGKLCERVPPSYRLILISGLPLLETKASGSTEPSCVEQ